MGLVIRFGGILETPTFTAGGVVPPLVFFCATGPLDLIAAEATLLRAGTMPLPVAEAEDLFVAVDAADLPADVGL